MEEDKTEFISEDFLLWMQNEKKSRLFVSCTRRTANQKTEISTKLCARGESPTLKELLSNADRGASQEDNCFSRELFLDRPIRDGEKIRFF